MGRGRTIEYGEDSKGKNGNNIIDSILKSLGIDIEDRDIAIDIEKLRNEIVNKLKEKSINIDNINLLQSFINELTEDEQIDVVKKSLRVTTTYIYRYKVHKTKNSAKDRKEKNNNLKKLRSKHVELNNKVGNYNGQESN